MGGPVAVEVIRDRGTAPSAAAKPVDFTLNGRAVDGSIRREPPRGGEAAWHRGSPPLLQGRHAAGWQLPRLRGRDQGRACARAVVLPLSHRRHGGHDRQRTGADQPEDGARAAALGRAGDVLHARFRARSVGAASSRSASPASQPGISRSEDVSHPAIAVHLDACIQCGRCVRACREEQVNDVIGYAFRGGHSKIVFDLDDPMGDVHLRRVR